MRGLKGVLAIASVVAMAMVTPAGAGAVTYGLTDVIEDTDGVAPVGVGVNQESHDLYIGNFLGPTFGEGNVARYSSAGVSLETFGSDSFSGVSITPLNQNVYAVGQGSSEYKVHTFSSAGTELGTPIELPAQQGFPRIDADSAGNVYVPNGNFNTVTKYDSAGSELEFSVAHPTIDCSDCPAPASFDFTTAVAVDFAGNIYVADRGNERVVKFDSSGAFKSVLTTGAVTQVAVNPANDDVFVSKGAGASYHVLGFDSSGAAVPGADFGETSIQDALGFGPGANQIAVDGGTGTVYVTDIEAIGAEFKGRVLVFDPVHPTATTTAASGITKTEAILKGTVNPNAGGAITSCEFEWGTTTAYSGGTVPCAANPPEGEVPVAVQGGLEGLASNTTYHYRLVADNGGGAVQGADQTLKTLPSPPAVVTGASSGVSQNAATLAGTVNPNGASVSACRFEYGTTVSYGSVANCASLPGAGESVVAVSAALSGLSAATTYHYRLVATNAGGSANGLDATFTTQSAPVPSPPISPAPTPPVSTPPPAKKPLKCKKGFKKKTVKGKARCVKVKKKHKKH